MKRRFYPMAWEIELARKAVLDKDDARAVWGELCLLADKKAGRMAARNEKGIQYGGEKFLNSGELDIFTNKQLVDRLARERKSR